MQVYGIGRMNYPVWLTESGDKVTCVEKIKVMEQNLAELHQVAQDAFEDGLLMEIDPKQLKQYLAQLMLSLENPYTKP